MAILVTCQCGQQFETGDANAGRRAVCPDCQRPLMIPKAKVATLPDLDEFGREELGDWSPTSGKAIVSLLCGLCFFCVGFTGIPAILLGWLSLRDINRSRGRIKGRGMALTGIVLGGLSTLLTGLLFPQGFFLGARESARQAQCTNNLKRIGLAVHNFHSTYNCFPAAAIVDRQGRPLLSWRVAILPYLGSEEAALYARFHLDEPWDSPNNAPLLSQMPSIYLCPSHLKPKAGATTYQVVVGRNTLFTGGKPIRLTEVPDGTSNTIMVGEASTAVPWTKPEELKVGGGVTSFGFDSEHPGGFNVLMADGSVRFIDSSIPQGSLSALVTRNGGDVNY